jgi:long-chain fatty acid transport protein
MIAVGIDYRVSSSVKLSFGSNYFFDRQADYGHKWDDDLNSSTPTVHLDNKSMIFHNGLSLQAGLEYNITEKLLVSGGYVWANKGVNDYYQSDLTYGLGTSTFGLGGAYSINEKIQINLGLGYTDYRSDSKLVNHVMGSSLYTPEESYYKSTMMVGIGVDFRF